MRVVLIDPSSADRYWMRMMLRETGIGHTLHEFSSAVAAIAELQAAPVGPVDALIVNVVLGFLEVDEVIAKLRQVAGMAEARCAVTVLDEFDFERVPAGCEALVKPVSAEALDKFLRKR